MEWCLQLKMTNGNHVNVLKLLLLTFTSDPEIEARLNYSLMSNCLQYCKWFSQHLNINLSDYIRVRSFYLRFTFHNEFSQQIIVHEQMFHKKCSLFFQLSNVFADFILMKYITFTANKVVIAIAVKWQFQWFILLLILNMKLFFLTVTQSCCSFS